MGRETTFGSCVTVKQKSLMNEPMIWWFVQSMRKLFPPSSIPRVLKEYREPWHPEFMPRTAWSLHNSFTEVMKSKPHLIPERTRILTGVFDQCLGIN